MKNKVIISVFLTLMFFSFFSKAQSGLTCNVLDKIEEGTLERKLDFKVSYIGFKSISEANDFCANMSKAHSDIQSIDCTGTDGKGNFFVDIKMKKPQDFQFYKGLFTKYGFSYFIINGEKKEILTMN
jgi:hypothetical protein